MVEPVHPFQGRMFDRLRAMPGALAVDHLCFVQTNHRLGKGIIIRTPNGAHRRFDARLEQSLGVGPPRGYRRLFRLSWAVLPHSLVGPDLGRFVWVSWYLLCRVVNDKSPAVVASKALRPNKVEHAGLCAASWMSRGQGSGQLACPPLAHTLGACADIHRLCTCRRATRSGVESSVRQFEASRS